MNLSELLSPFKKESGSTKSHIKNLIEMAAADGNFMDVEYDLLKKTANQNGVSESRLKEIRKNPGLIKFEISKDPLERFKHLYDLVQMMSIDDDVHPDEIKLCTLLAIRFGYQRSNIKELIEITRAHIKNNKDSLTTLKSVSHLIE